MRQFGFGNGSISHPIRTRCSCLSLYGLLATASGSKAATEQEAEQRVLRIDSFSFVREGRDDYCQRDDTETDSCQVSERWDPRSLGAASV